MDEFLETSKSILLVSLRC